MKGTLNIRTVGSVGLGGLLLATLATAYARADSWGRREATNPTALLGSALPAVSLRSVDGQVVPLAGRVSRGFSLIILLGAKDCFSCSSYALELKILKSKLPGITPILIGSGGDEALFRDYFRREHLESVALLDPDRALLTALHLESEPLVLLVDPEGRLLFVDTRSSSAAAQFPFGRLLPLLGGALQPVSTPTPKNGETK